MSIPGEHKTVQARIREHAEEIGCWFVRRENAGKGSGTTKESGKQEE